MKKKKKDELEVRKSKSILLPMAERLALGARRPRDIVSCSECGEDAERSPANGKWRCMAATDTFSHLDSFGKPVTFAVLTCTATGSTLPNGELVTTSQIQRDKN